VSLMNAAIRFVVGLRSRDHVSTAQRDLHWLPIEQNSVSFTNFVS